MAGLYTCIMSSVQGLRYEVGGQRLMSSDFVLVPKVYDYLPQVRVRSRSSHLIYAVVRIKQQYVSTWL